MSCEFWTACCHATFAFVVSEALLAEYRTVLLWPKLCKLHGLTEPEVDIILTDLAYHAIVLAPGYTVSHEWQ